MHLRNRQRWRTYINLLGSLMQTFKRKCNSLALLAAEIFSVQGPSLTAQVTPIQTQSLFE